MKKRFEKFHSLGQLGNMKKRHFDPPPAEYMSQRPEHQMKYRRPKATGAPDPSLKYLGNDAKDERRQRWLKKKRGYTQLDMGG